MTHRSSFKFGFDIVMEKGSCPRPVAIRAWDSPEKFPTAPHAPFKYMADALCGLSMVRLNPNLSCPAQKKKNDPSFCDEAWNHLDPHIELWKRCQDRVQALHHEVPKIDGKTCADFEKDFNEILDSAMKADGVDLKTLWGLVDTINDLESRKSSPLLYNFGLKFSPGFTQKLHWMYSLLFHLRSVVAVDWNAHIDDASHEAVKVDSITDYIPKAEYVVQDALLYWNFQKLSHPFVAGRTSDVKVEKLLVEPMKRAFQQSSHNACHLIDHLPKSFLNRLSPSDIEETLYMVQMDWLLGSEAGLLFRIREELYGLQNGYDRIFWHDLQGAPAKKAFHLSLCFEISGKDFDQKAA